MRYSPLRCGVIGDYKTDYVTSQIVLAGIEEEERGNSPWETLVVEKY
jgi:hypothetical protein